ncbi:DNRLRE domain-containing protein, partial [Halalkalibacter alkalisediminis]
MTHLFSKIFIIFVAFTVLFSSIPFTAMVQANDRTLSFDERIGLDDPENELRIQMSDADAEQVISNFTQDIQSKEPVEIIEERTEVSKLFDNMDGTITEEFFLEPVHVQEDDDLVDISSMLVPSEDDESIITTEQTIIDVEFPLDVNDNVVTVKQEDHFLSYEWIEAEGEEGIQQAEIPEVEYEENFLYHRGVFPGIDVRNVLFNTSLKEDIVIYEPTSLSTFRVQVNTNLHGQVEKDGSVTWSSGEEVIFTTPTPFMTDSNIDELSGEPSISYDVKFELEENQEGYLLTLSVDSDWLNDDERVYPVYIDPTTNVGTSADTFVTSAYPTTTNDKFWESSSGYYSLKVGYYDASSGTNFSFVRQDLSHLKGVAISSATFKIYTAHSYYGTTANGVWLDSVNENWSAATATWNNKPSSSNITSTNVHRGQWAEFDVTSTVQSWVDGKKDNYGFKLHTNGNGQTHWKKFYASENSTSKPVLSVTYTLPTPAKPTVTGVNTNDGTDTGYFNLSWSAISGAKSYIVYIYNGNEYEGINVGNVTSWTTRGKKLWPTDEQLFNGRYWLNWDGKGQELPVDPSDTYQVSGGNYPTDTNYRFRIAAVYEVGTSSMSGTTMPYLPLSKPKRPVGAASVNLDDQSGYVHATWEEVQGATGYKVLLYNGTAYEQVADVKVDPKKPNQALQWNSQNKKLWPTATDIANGRYNLRLDGTGTELAKDPSPVYKNSGGSYTTNKNYLIRVKAYNNKHPDSANSDAFSPTIPDLRGPFLGSEPYWPQFITKVGTVNALNGNLSFSETDETFSGRGPSILISRTYNSLAQSKGSFGTGWLFSYDIQLNEQTNGDVILREEDGTEHYYKKSGTTYIPPHGLYLKLEKIDTQFVLTTKSQDKWYFSNGRLVKIEDGTRKENLVTFTYPTNQTVITDASGRKITVNYSNQKISTISDYTNRTWVYSYTGDLLTQVTYPDGQTKTYQYNNGQLTEIWDFKQKKTTITYDTQKRFKSVIDPIGKTTTVSYGTNQATITHPAAPNDGGTSVASSDVIRYSIAGNPTELMTDNGTGKLNLKTTYQYNLHEMVSTKDPRANKEGRPSEQAIYDGNGNVIEYIGANGEQEVAIYNKNDDIISYTDALGETYETAYDGVLEVTTNDPAKTSTMTLYDDFGNVTHSTKELSVAYNLLTNGGFEKDSTTYSGWTVRRGNGDEGTVSLNTTHKKQERSIRLSHKPSATRDKTKLSYISVTQDIDVEENTLYTLSGLIKTENLNGRAFFNIYQMNGTSGVSAPWIDNRYNYLSGTNDWTERQLSFKTKPGVNRIRVYLEIDDEANGSTGGAAYFDNIQLEHGQVSSSYNPVQNSGLENITPNQGS